MTYTPRRLLVTGGAGFIGSHYIRHQLAADPDLRIVNLDALTYAGNPDNLRDLPGAERHVFVHGDINDAGLVQRLLREHALDGIVNFAAETHVDRSIAGPAPFMQSNVQGVLVLLEAARQVWMIEQGLEGELLAAQRRFHQIGTDEVYGSLTPEAPAFTEASPYAPRSPYAASKAAADHLVRAWHATWGLPVVLSACSNNYGPRQHAEKLIPLVLRRGRSGEPIPVYGDGLYVRDWLHVDDHCSALDAILRRGRRGQTYNVGAGNEWTTLALVQQLCRLLDERRPAGRPHEALLRFVEDRPGHDRRYAIDAGRLRRELGWEPCRDFGAALAATVDWYLSRPD